MTMIIRAVKIRFYSKYFFEFFHNHRIYRFAEECSNKKLDTILFLKGIKIPTIDRIHVYNDDRFIFYGIDIDSDLILSCGVFSNSIF